MTESMLYLLIVSFFGIAVILGFYVFPGIKRIYNRKETYTNKLLVLWFSMWAFHHVSLILSSFYGIWEVPIARKVALPVGVALAFTGGIVLLIGMIEFRSLSRSIGQDTSKLITTGIYHWSRNPQFVGWFFLLGGIALAGRSGYAILLSIVFVIVIWSYTIFLAEPYLEDLYGNEYRLYKARTARWIGRRSKVTN
ncbi:MAG: isoprenylcysteine carboxylmethyltransferase family protein [FCB group bacterium]|nr:isoprenylcysteine carboxylmethyltransferase family protein [FCB group bacterium]